MYRIALVEDEDALREVITAYLRREGWEVDAFEGVRSAWKRIDADYHIWILDLMLPDGNGFEILRNVRQKHSDMPVIMISARDAELDRVIGLEMGSDDYLPKPFLPQELVIRTRRLLERIYGKGNSQLTVQSGLQTSAEESIQNGLNIINWEPYKIDSVRRCAWYNHELIDLTTKEFDLLLMFSQHKGQAFSREQLLYRVWGDDFIGSDRVVDDLVRRLRKKCPAIRLETLYGYGYRAV